MFILNNSMQFVCIDCLDVKLFFKEKKVYWSIQQESVVLRPKSEASTFFRISPTIIEVNGTGYCLTVDSGNIIKLGNVYNQCFTT